MKPRWHSEGTIFQRLNQNSTGKTMEMKKVQGRQCAKCAYSPSLNVSASTDEQELYLSSHIFMAVKTAYSKRNVDLDSGGIQHRKHGQS